MKLQKLKICNFRSFKNEEIFEFDELNGLIGANSTGKSSALLALCKLFSENSSERTISKKDFFQVEPEKNRYLYIEAVLQTNIGTTETPLFFEHYVVDNQGESPYLRIRLEATWEDDGTIEGAIDSRIYFITCPEDEEIHEANKMSANRNVLNKIRVIYVPALRNPNLQLKNVSGSMMNRIMRGINWSDDTKASIKNLINDLNDVTASEKGIVILQEAIKNKWGKYQSDKRYSKASLVFNSDNVESALTKAEVIFSSQEGEGYSSIDDMGDGHRSLFYISIIESFLDIEEKINTEESEGYKKSIDLSPPLLTILAVEEPENHIAPHLLGKLLLKLRNVSKKENAQVVLTSHSSAIIKRISPNEIRYLRLDIESQSTKVKSISLPEEEIYADEYKFVKEAVTAYPELYFSKLVILGEGDSEELILSKFFEINGGNVDISEISVVPLGGRFVNHFWRLLADLEIPYITLLDLDRERSGGGWGRIKYALTQLIARGYNRDEILQLADGNVMSKETFLRMHNWDVANIKCMESWITRLENYGIFFSSPLDIDFLMLEIFEDSYKYILSENEGPRLKIDGESKPIKELGDELFESKEYNSRIKDSVHATLKKEGGKGDTYTDNQQKLMIWYNYFFLGRGKPTTHISMFANIDEEKLKKSTPEVIKKIIAKANHILTGDVQDE